MRTLIALVLLAGSTVAHAVEPTPPPAPPAHATAVIHIGISDGGEYAVTVAHDGAPTVLVVRNDAETVDLRLFFVDGGRLRYDLKRSGPHPFTLAGEALPPRGRPAVIGHFAVGSQVVAVRLRATDW